MKRFIQTEFFRLLQNNSRKGISIKKLEKAYKEFVETLLAENNMLALPGYRNALYRAGEELACLRNQGEMKKKQYCIYLY